MNGDDPNKKEGDTSSSSYSYEKVKKHAYTTSITTNFKHLHQVPMALTEKIFNKKKDSLVVGHDDTSIGDGSIKVTYMGQNAKQYNTFEDKVR